MPAVSVIIPTCNRAEQTQTCLDALAVQTHDAFEVIVIDDGSTDGTADMLATYRAEHPGLELVVLTNPSNRGANASRNLGIETARGAYLAFLDSDCIPQPDWLQRLLEPFEDPAVAAVTGLVTDPPPTNVYELCFLGTHRIGRAGPARRLVAGNMALHRAHLESIAFDEALRDAAGTDTTFSGRCDEEGIAIRLRRAGHPLVAQPAAVVLHDHGYDRRAFFRQAWHGGRAAAELVRGYGLPHRLDVLPFVLAWATMPIALALLWWLGPLVLLAPATLLLAALSAITWNDLTRKGKTIGQWLRSLHVLVAYYHVRAAGYVFEMLCGRRTS